MRLGAAVVSLVALGTTAARAGPLADVFEVSPLVTPDRVRVELALPDGAERLATAAVEVLNCPDTGGCSEIYPGTRYHACQPVPLAQPDADGNFIYPFAGDTAPDDPLAEVMAFYQVHKALEVAGRLGLAGLAEPLHVVVNVHRYDAGTLADCADGDYDGQVPLEPLDTAYFTTTGQGLGVDRAGFYLVLPQGHAVDLAFDGDIVQHELGHAVMASVAPGLPRTLLDEVGTDPSPGGLHEGFADLLTLMVTGDPVIAEYAGSGEGDGGPLRDLAEPAGCPDDLVGEPHADSRPFSSAVFAARREIAGDQPEPAAAFDRAVMAAWIRLGERAGYQRAAALIAEELAGGALGAGAATTAEAIFADHGLDGCDRRVVDGAAGKPLAVLPGVADPERGGTVPGIFQLRIALDQPAGEIALAVALVDTGAPELRRLSALLAAGGEPIGWRIDAAGEPVSDATLEIPLEVDGERRARAVFAGPFEPGVYHLMLANHGGRVTLHQTRVEVMPIDDGGCACGTGGGGRAWLAVLALACLLVWRPPAIPGGRRGRSRPRGRRR